MTAYHVPAADALIKLDAMENPYPLPAAIQARIAAAVARVPVNRYPDAGAKAVKRALRDGLHLPGTCGLVLGNGSDELIQMIALVLARPGAVALAPEPTFVMYRLSATFAGLRYVGVPLAPDFALDRRAMLDAIAAHAPAVVFLAHPNNPTGNLFDDDDIEAILAAAPGLVVVDEAYTAFAQASFLDRLHARPNLLVLRTLSKIGMAGLRLGYAVADRAWTSELEKVRPPYNVNALTQAAVPVLLDEAALLEAQAARIRAERERVASRLAMLPGVRVHPSRANFVTVRAPDAPRWLAALADARILVKSLHGSHPLLEHCLRITIGTPAENDAVMAVLAPLAGVGAGIRSREVSP